MVRKLWVTRSSRNMDEGEVLSSSLDRLYLLIDLHVNLVPLSVAANQRRGFMEILHCDWLHPKVGQNYLFEVEVD